MPGAKRIYLVRHAKAEEDRGGGDSTRRLTAEGRARFEALLARLAALPVSAIVTSPYVRARQTADLLSRATGAAVTEDGELASGRSGGREILSLARRCADGTALVGHNPEMAEAVALASGRDETVKPGTIAALDVGDAIALAWLERPPPA